MVFGNNEQDIAIDIPFRIESQVRSCIQYSSLRSDVEARKLVLMILLKGEASRCSFLVNEVKQKIGE